MSSANRVTAVVKLWNTNWSSICNQLFIYSIPVAYAALFIEALRYFGFLKRYGIDVSAVILLSLALGLAAFFSKQLHRTVTLLYAFLPLFLMGTMFVLTILSSTEIHKGIGHVRMEFGIQLSTIVIIALYTGALLLLPIAHRQLERLPQPLLSKTIVVSFLLLYVYFFRIQEMFDLVLARTSRTEDLITKTDRERTGSLWSHAAALLYFIEKNTPENAVILHPIQDNPWPETGNQYVVRRFLYPRTLIAPEWGKGSPTHIIVDDGSPNHAQYADKLDRIGWPYEIYPSRDVLLMDPWQKQIKVESVASNAENLPILPKEAGGTYSGELTITKDFDTTTIETSFTKLEYALVTLTPAVPLNDQTYFKITADISEGFATAPVLIVTDESTQAQYTLYFSANDKPGMQTMQIELPYARLKELLQAEKQPLNSSYTAVVALDVGYSKPMPFMYHKGLLTLPTTINTPSETCVLPTDCLYQLEDLVYQKNFSQAELLLPKLHALMPNNGYFNYLAFITLRELGTHQDLALQYLQQAAHFWSVDPAYNLPRLILSTYDPETMRQNNLPKAKP